MKCLEMFINLQSLLVSTFDVSFGVVAALHLTGEFPRVTCARSESPALILNLFEDS